VKYSIEKSGDKWVMTIYGVEDLLLDFSEKLTQCREIFITSGSYQTLMQIAISLEDVSIDLGED